MRPVSYHRPTAGWDRRVAQAWCHGAMVLVVREREKRPFRPDPLCAHGFAPSAVAPWESEISGNVKHRPFRLYDRPLPRTPGNTVTSPHPPLFMCRRLWGDTGPPDCTMYRRQRGQSHGFGSHGGVWSSGSSWAVCAPANGSLALAVATASRPSQSCPSVAGAPFGTDPRLACSLRIAPGSSGAI